VSGSWAGRAFRDGQCGESCASNDGIVNQQQTDGLDQHRKSTLVRSRTIDYAILAKYEHAIAWTG